MANFFRIKQRLYSSNIIEVGTIVDDKIKWEPYIAPLIRKQDGDKLCEEIFNHISRV